jgi:hypothetical protein
MASCVTKVLPSKHANNLAKRASRYKFLENKSVYALTRDYEMYRETDKILVFRQKELVCEGRAVKKRWVTRGVKKPLNKKGQGFRCRQTKSLEWYDPQSRTFGILASKRGNPAYQYRVKQSLGRLANEFDDDVFDYVASPFANVIYITLTDDRAVSRHEHILNFNKWWGQYTAWLRCKFGKLSTFIGIECHDDGYFHAHAVIIFDEMYFKVFEYWKLDKATGRESKHWLLDDSDFVASGWQHGWVSMKAVTGLQGLINYLVKYITKSTYCPAKNMDKDSKVVKTLATLSAYGKRAFAVSGKFREAVNLIRYSLSKRKFLQVTLEGKPIPRGKCQYLGSFPTTLLGLAGDRLHFEFDKYQVGVISAFLENELSVKKRCCIE